MEEEATEKILVATCATLKSLEIGNNDVVPLTKQDNVDDNDYDEKNLVGIGDDDKECTSILSVISNEEASIISEIYEMKSFCPRKNSDGEDVNGHIGHIDSPETDTYPNSDPLQGESLMDDIRSMLGTDIYGYDQDSMENTYTDDTTLFQSNADTYETKLTRKKSTTKRRNSKITEDDTTSTTATQFGFENRAFMSQHVYLDNNRFDNEPPIRYCSLAQFVEGSDIARRSFKRTKPTKLTKTETNVNRQSTLTEESETLSVRGSKTSLNKYEKEMSNLKETIEHTVDNDDDAKLKFPQVRLN